MIRSTILIVILAVITLSIAHAELLVKIMLEGPKCLDGSPAGYYGRRNSTSSRYVIFLQGGGACAATRDCAIRKKTQLGSSTNWPKLKDVLDPFYVLSDDPAINPDFYEWNHVYVPYCSGDLWIGEQTNPTNPFNDGGSDTFLFQGHLILEALVGQLQRQPTDILLTGCSAGGMGTFYHADWLRETITVAGVTIKANPEAGWFGQYAYDRWPYFVAGVPDPDPTHLNGTGTKWLRNITVFHPSMERSCQADPAADQRYCTSIPYLYKYIKTPMFVTEAGSDQYQVEHQGEMPHQGSTLNETQKAYIVHFGDQLRASLRKEILLGPKNTSDGLFTPACFSHCRKLWTTTHVKGYSLATVLGNWYFSRAGPTQLLDPSNNISDFLACA